MKKSFTFIIISISIFYFMCSTPLPNDPDSQCRKIWFTSKYVKKKTYFLVYLPQNLDGPAPVLYLLNGGNQDPYGWRTGADLQGGADAYNMIIISIASIFYDYKDVYGTDELYESYVLEIVDIVDDIYDTKTSKYSRGIGGYSMGGGGAFYVGSRHTDLFISITSMSGGYSSQDPPNWEGLRNQLILFDCGIDDTAITGNREIHQILNIRDIPHFYNEYEGGHTYGYMSQHYEEHLKFHSEVFKLYE